MPGGRPTDYDPKYCDEVISYMSSGKHVIQFAAHLGVAKSTIYQWAQDNPEFSVALKKAQAASTAWWINLHQNKASGAQKEGSDVLIIQMLKCKDREEFGDHQKVEVKSEGNSVLNAVSTETLSAIARDLTAKQSNNQ